MPPTKRILRFPAVKVRTGLSKSALYKHIAEGTFPKPVALGRRAVGGSESQVDAWIEQLSAKP